MNAHRTQLLRRRSGACTGDVTTTALGCGFIQGGTALTYRPPRASPPQSAQRRLQSVVKATVAVVVAMAMVAVVMVVETDKQGDPH
jgi:hypothetical protein